MESRGRDDGVFSVTAGYALRTLICLARLPQDTSLPGHELARRAKVPVHYLSKMLLPLGRAGIVAASRGSGGGYRLLSDAMEVPLIDIVEIFDGPRAKPSCLLGRHRVCSDEDPCPAHDSWRQVRDSYIHFLEATTLADISTSPLEPELLPAAEHHDV